MTFDRALSAALFAVVAAGSCVAQSGLAPSEAPPAGYAGGEYVDSRGCLFVQRGASWLPVFGAGDAQVCDRARTLARAPERRSTVVTLDVPVVTSGAVRWAPATARRVPVEAPVTNRILQPGPPKGYRQVFDDGRHNPHRGERTAAGREQMGRVWTDDVPRRLRSGRGVLPQEGRLTVSTKSAPAQVRQSFVQVGAYGSAANAERAMARLRGVGLPARAVAGRGGLRVVVAGPFTSAAEARRGVATARRAGFADAFATR